MLNKYQTQLVVDLDAIFHNVNAIKAYTGKLIFAVIKADAYGHGAVEIAKHLDGHVDMFAVATVEEAIELRNERIETPILILCHTLLNHNVHYDLIEHIIVNKFTLTTDSLDSAKSLNHNSAFVKMISLGQAPNLRIHVDINTGMNRSGIDFKEANSFLDELKTLPRVDVTGIFTHFANAEEADKRFSHQQLERFNSVIENVPDDMIIHAANSAATLAIPESHYDSVRPGLSLYGIYPGDEKPIVLQPALTWKAYINWIQTIEAGEGVSYGLTYKTETQIRVAGIRVGFADGYPRALSNCGEVLIDGKRRPIIGRICMDLMVVKLGQTGWESVGDEVVLIGKQGNEEMSINEIAEKADTIPYEILTRIGKRVKRIYKESNT